MQWKSKTLKFKNPSKQSKDINKGAFFSLALIPKHSCGIFTALLSHVNTTSETGDWELCWNSASSYHHFSGRPSLTLKGCHSEVGQEEEVWKTFATVVLRLWKENLIYFNGFLSITSESVYLSPHVNEELNFKRLFFQKGCLLWFTVKVGCCL